MVEGGLINYCGKYKWKGKKVSELTFLVVNMHQNVKQEKKYFFYISSISTFVFFFFSSIYKYLLSPFKNQIKKMILNTKQIDFLFK